MFDIDITWTFPVYIKQTYLACLYNKIIGVRFIHIQCLTVKSFAKVTISAQWNSELFPFRGEGRDLVLRWVQFSLSR